MPGPIITPAGSPAHLESPFRTVVLRDGWRVGTSLLVALFRRSSKLEKRTWPTRPLRATSANDARWSHRSCLCSLFHGNGRPRPGRAHELGPPQRTAEKHWAFRFDERGCLTAQDPDVRIG